MPYYPIRLEQLNNPQLSGFVTALIEGRFVLLTGNQNISGVKSFLNNYTSFGSAGQIQIGTDLPVGVGAGMWGGGDIGVDIENGFLFQADGTTLDWFSKKISGLWEAENLKTNSARINRKVINSPSYTVLSSDYYLAVNSSGSAKTLFFPTPSDARVYKVKDVAGMATGNNITLSGAGVTFDYQPTFVINDAYASIELIAGSGNNYEIF